MRSGSGADSIPGAMTPDRTLVDNKYADDDDEDDDMVAIPGEDTLLRADREGDGGPGYRQLDGSGMSSGRRMDRSAILRKIAINLALIGSWCECIAAVNQDVAGVLTVPFP